MGYQDREYFKSNFSHPDYTPPIKGNLPLQLALGCFFLGLLNTLLSTTVLKIIFDITPDAVLHGRIWGLIFAPFAAKGWMIFIHSLMVYFFARVCIFEDGVRRFLIYYVSLGLLSSFIYYIFAGAYISHSDFRLFPQPEVWQLCLDGVIMVLAVRRPKMVVNLFGLLPIQIRYLVGIYVFLEIYHVVQITNQSPGAVFVAVTASKVSVFVLAFLYAKYQRKIELKLISLRPKSVMTSSRVDTVLSEMSEAEIKKEVDRILDKISDKSIASLTEQERQFLKKSSQKFKQ